MAKRRQRGGPNPAKRRKAEGKSQETGEDVPKPAGGAYTEIVYENAGYENYYKHQNLFPAEEWDEFLEHMKKSLPAALRVNMSSPLWRSTQGVFKRMSEPENGDHRIQELTWFPKELGYQWPNLDKITIRKQKHLSALKALLIDEDFRGAICRQETVSMIPPLFLDLEPHHVVLDMCAAPGSKTKEMLDFMMRPHKSDANHSVAKMTGVVVANDVDVMRANMLTHQLMRLPSPCVATVCVDAGFFPTLRPNDLKGAWLQFDRVLADVPCSGDGTLRKAPDIWKSWKPSGGVALHVKQVAILSRGLQVLKEGGRLVYSTCSLNPIEDEAVVNHVLRKYSGCVELVEPPSFPGLKFQPGVSKWLVPDIADKTCETFFGNWEDTKGTPARSFLRPSMFSSEEEKEDGPPRVPLERCCRFLPHHNNSGGFFVAAMVKTKAKLIPFGEKDESKAPKEEVGAAVLTEEANPGTEEQPAEEGEEKSVETGLEPPAASDLVEGACDTSTSSDAPLDTPKSSTLEKSDALASEVPTEHARSTTAEVNKKEEKEKQHNVMLAKGAHAHDFVCLEENYQGWSNIEEFFNVSQKAIDEFDGASTSHTNLDLRVAASSNSSGTYLFIDKGLEAQNFAMRKHTEKRLFLVSESLRCILTKFIARANLKLVHAGVRVFELLDSKQRERFGGCQWRIVQEGVSFVLPHMRRRVVFVHPDVGRVLLMGERKLSRQILLEFERQKKVCNLDSCRKSDSSDIVPGSAICIIVPPHLLPTPDLTPPEEETMEIQTYDEKGEKGEVESKEWPKELVNPEPFKGSPEFLEGGLDESLPISCLVSPGGHMLPYINKKEAAGLVHMLWPTEEEIEMLPALVSKVKR